MKNELIWEGNDGLDKYRLIKIPTGESVIYLFERSQQQDSLGVDIWHQYLEVPSNLVVMLLQHPTPDTVKDIDTTKGGRTIK